MSPATMQKMFNKDLHLHAYKVHLTQKLKSSTTENDGNSLNGSWKGNERARVL